MRKDVERMDRDEAINVPPNCTIFGCWGQYNMFEAPTQIALLFGPYSRKIEGNLSGRRTLY